MNSEEKERKTIKRARKKKKSSKLKLPSKGKLVFKDAVYEGDFNAAGDFHGKGKMTYADGRVEEGYWKDGKFEGNEALGIEEKILNKCIIVLENIDFVPVTMEDLQLGYDLWKLTQKEYLEKINGIWNEEFEVENYKNECIRNLENNYMIKYHENSVGWLEYDIYNDYIFIKQLHIVPEYQNNGIGTRILNECFAYGKKVNKNICLEVLQGNERALGYYKKLGFKEYDESSVSITLEYEI